MVQDGEAAVVEAVVTKEYMTPDPEKSSLAPVGRHKGIATIMKW